MEIDKFYLQSRFEGPNVEACWICRRVLLDKDTGVEYELEFYVPDAAGEPSLKAVEYLLSILKNWTLSTANARRGSTRDWITGTNSR